MVFHGNVGIREVLSARCATPESEVIVEVSLAHPYNAGSAGHKEPDAQQASGVWVCLF
jgi:hypothetical protein